MSSPRAPAGARVSTGRLRVDAARAVHKLREYQLPDPTMWVLEVIRAAVAIGAESIFVRGDSDDVWVGWNGPPLDAQVLPRLLDELVDPAPSAERRPLRLFATGLNTALGADPRWVDVYVASGEHEGLRVRYTPSLLEPTNDESDVAEGLRRLSAEPWPLPAEAPRRGVLVHLRRLPLLGSVPLMIGFGEPAELTVARGSCDDIAVPLTISRTEVGRDRSHHDLLRLRLGAPLDGFVAVLDPAVASPNVQLHVAELGVLLARYELPLEAFDKPRTKVPLRVFVDAPRMPTNASRAAVRLDADPLPAALERARSRMPELVARLAKELSSKAEHRWSPIQRERLRAAALLLIASRVAGHAWRSDLARLREGDAVLSLLADLPILRDALGRPRAAASFALRDGCEVVHFERDPVASELEPWLGQVLWVPPGDWAVALLGDWRASSTDGLLSRTRSWRRARDRFLAEAERPAQVASAAWQILAVPLRAPGLSLKSAVPVACFDVPALEGQVVLLDPRRTKSSAVGYRVDGRELELAQPKLRVPISAVASSSALRPAPDFASVLRDEAFDSVSRAVRAASVVACEALALRLGGKRKQGDRAELRGKRMLEGGDEQDRDALEHLVRAGLGLALDVRAECLEGDAEKRACDSKIVATRSPLVTAPVWVGLDGNRHSLEQLVAMARRLSGALCVASPRARADPSMPAPAHPVIRASREEREILERALAPRAVVSYDEPLARAPQRRDAVSLARGLASGAVLALYGDGFDAAITWADREPGTLELRHFGRPLSRAPLAGTLAPCSAVVDDSAIVPSADWSAVHHHDRALDFAEWERLLARALIAHLAGQPSEALVVTSAWPASAIDALLSALAAASSPREWLGAESFEQFLDLPLILRIGQPGLVSARDLSRAFTGAIPYVGAEAASGGIAGDFSPPVLRSLHKDALARILDRSFELADDELARRRVAARRERALESHRARPEAPRARVWEPAVDLEVRVARSARFGLSPALQTGARIEALVEGRSFAEWSDPDELPVRGIVDLPETDADETFTALTASAQSKLRGLIQRGAEALLHHLAETSPTALVSRPDAWTLLRARASRPFLREGASILAVLRKAPMFATVQGGPVALADIEGDEVRVASIEDVWIGSLGARDDLDDPILRVSDDDRVRAEQIEVIGRLEHHRAVTDVSAAVARLQSQRRIEQGLVDAPRLGARVDPRLRFSLVDLLRSEPDALAVLGVGEVGLVEVGPTWVHFFSGGRRLTSVSLDLVPHVEVACESPLVRRGRFDEAASLERLRDAVRVVIGLAIRRAVDAIPGSELPEWFRRILRASALLGGTVHLERLSETPIFETTAGAWVSPKALRDQAARFGALWWTVSRERLEPLDPARFAIVSSVSDAHLLKPFVELADGTEELRLDERARRNLARPAVDSLEPSADELAAALGVERLAPEGEELSRGTIVILRPGAEQRRGLHVHREMRALGALRDPSRWPVLARMEDPRLTPDRTFSSPVEDPVLAALRGRVRRTADRALAALAPFPSNKLAAMRVRAWMHLASLDDGAVEGVAWLEHGIGPGAVTVIDANGERTIVPHSPAGTPLALHAKLWISGPCPEARLRPIFASVQAELCSRLMERGKTSENALAHILLAASASVLDPREHRSGAVALPMIEPEMSLGELGHHLAADGLVTLVPARDRARAEAAASKKPWLLDDGSIAAMLLLKILGPRAVDMRSELSSRVLGAEASTSSEPVPVPIVASPAPAMEPQAGRERPLVAALREELERLGIHGALVRTITVAYRKKPCVSLASSELVLASRHPVVHAALQAFETGDPSARARARLLTAHVVGICHRQTGAVGAGGETGLLVDLLREAR